MKMTRQHFQALADSCATIIGNIVQDCAPTSESFEWQKSEIVSEFLRLCHGSNPNFNEYRFVEWVEKKLEENTNNA
jgi:hypothetical protein